MNENPRRSLALEVALVVGGGRGCERGHQRHEVEADEVDEEAERHRDGAEVGDDGGAADVLEEARRQRLGPRARRVGQLTRFRCSRSRAAREQEL